MMKKYSASVRFHIPNKIHYVDNNETYSRITRALIAFPIVNYTIVILHALASKINYSTIHQQHQPGETTEASRMQIHTRNPLDCKFRSSDIMGSAETRTLHVRLASCAIKVRNAQKPARLVWHSDAAHGITRCTGSLREISKSSSRIEKKKKRYCRAHCFIRSRVVYLSRATKFQMTRVAAAAAVASRV